MVAALDQQWGFLDPYLDPRLGDVVGSLEARYGSSGRAQWGLVPTRWRCEDALETRLRQGLTEGCPGQEVTGLVSRVWVDIGGVRNSWYNR